MEEKLNKMDWNHDPKLGQFLSRKGVEYLIEKHYIDRDEIEMMPLMDVEFTGKPEEYDPEDMYEIIQNLILWRKNVLAKQTTPTP